MVWCAALYCKSDSRHTKHLRFYSFPADQARRRKWEIVCQRSNWQASKFAKLCEKHFDESQYEKNRKDGWKKLKPNAVPSMKNVSVCLKRLPLMKESCHLKENDGKIDESFESDIQSKRGNNSRESTESAEEESSKEVISCVEQSDEDGKNNSKSRVVSDASAEQVNSLPSKMQRKRKFTSAIPSQKSGAESDSSVEMIGSPRTKHRRTDADFDAADQLESRLTNQSPGGNSEEHQIDNSAVDDSNLSTSKSNNDNNNDDGDDENSKHCSGSKALQKFLTMADRMASLKSDNRGGRRFSFGSSRSPSFDLEKQMHDKEENLLKEWGTSVKYRQEDMLSIRPLPLASSNDPVKTGTSRNMRPPIETSSCSSSFDFPEIDVVKRHDSTLNDSTEIIESDSRWVTYFDCPDTGQKYMKMNINVDGFEPNDITVKSSGGRLMIHGISYEIIDGTKHTNEFCKKIKLPKEVAAENVRCTFSDHVLVLEAPVKAQYLISRAQEPNKLPLNCPVILTDENGKYLSLTVELGRIFKPCDVVVRVRGQQTISIVAESVENTPFSRMKAKLEREFDLPEKIDRKTLKAGCTDDLMLKIVARVKNDPSHCTKSVLGDTGNCVL